MSDRTLTGDIYCVGGFDPRFNSDDMRAFVEAIHKMGVDTIRGNIYADKSMKDADQFAPDGAGTTTAPCSRRCSSVGKTRS